MNVTKQRLEEAAGHQILTNDQVDALWRFMEQSHEAPAPEGGRFTFTNVLYYFGGLLAIGAMTLFMTLGWQRFGGYGLAAIALCYAATALIAWRQLEARNLQIPAGILASLAVCLIPLAVYGFQYALHMWPYSRPYRDYTYWIDGRWIAMEMATLLFGGLVLRGTRAPFVVMPLAVTLYFMGMDYGRLICKQQILPLGYDCARHIALVVGFMMLVLGFLVDAKWQRKPDYGFWLYVFGMIGFWGALTATPSHTEVARFFYAILNAGFVFLGVVLARRVFTIFGAIGVFGYLGHLSYDLFKDSVLFPISLTILGLGIMALGIWWQRHEQSIRDRFGVWMPRAIRDAL